VSQLAFLGRRLLAAAILIVVVSIGVFLMTHLGPGDAALARSSADATPEEIAVIREQLGLDRPLAEQYVSWAGGLLHGDLGNSLITGDPVGETLISRFLVTLSLASLAVLFSVPLAFVGGIISGSRPGSLLDRTIFNTSSVLIGVPSFFVGLVLIHLVAARGTLFPTYGYTDLVTDPYEWFRHLVLPAITLGLLAAGELTRQLRGSMVDVMERDYIRTAAAKGLRPALILRRHAFRNAALPALTLLGLLVISLLGGSAVVETVFALPGLGREIVTATLGGDIPLIQGIVLVIAVLAIVINTVVDISYRLLDPRVKIS